MHYNAFLSLAPSTGHVGLFALLCGRGQPLLAPARLWSLARLLAILLVPIVGVVIMSICNFRVADEGHSLPNT